ncbi:MAG: hypothetical protein IMZ73_06020 [Chloroflexi bacterium]|nr:hypothetical protein [Chloroflexota bacterium]
MAKRTPSGTLPDGFHLIPPDFFILRDQWQGFYLALHNQQTVERVRVVGRQINHTHWVSDLYRQRQEAVLAHATGDVAPRFFGQG